ncbi:MAG: nuclear transport factor 2 family protein, partial [Thermoanaerobaculia bacterium]
MKLRIAVVFCVFHSVVVAPFAKAASPEEAVVRQTVQAYLHGLQFNDVPSLKVAFHPEAKLFFAKKDGSLGQITQEQWYKGFE